MKIVVVSDTHGDSEILSKIEMLYPNADIFLHLGDSQLSEYQLGRFISVKGNCDYFSDFPETRIITTPYGKIFVEHGHRRLYGISEAFLRENDCKIYLSGHTHCHSLKKINEIYYVNPGSVTRPRDGTNGTYLVINLTNNNVEFEFKNI